MTGAVAGDSKKTCFFVCTNHFRDVRAALKDPAFDGIEAHSFPACRGGGPQTIGEEAAVDADERGIVMGGSCTPGRTTSIGQSEHCLGWYWDRDALTRRAQEGAYVLTPGWLAGWKARMGEWGLDKATARELFAESCSHLLLIDTGTEEHSAELLAELGDFLDRPTKTLEVGLSHLRLDLRRRLLEHQLAAARKAQAAADRRAADHAMAIEMLSSVAELADEDRVIGTLTTLLTMLFAADRVDYLGLDAGHQPTRFWSNGSRAPARDDDIARLQTLAKPWQWTESGAGFRVRVAHGDEVLGVLEVDGVTFPQHRQAYLDLALRVATVTGLAVSNARSFDQLRRAEEATRRTAEELQRSNAELERFAFVASHDLQAPLRKVLAFGNRLSTRGADQLDDRGREYLDRMLSAGTRMRSLIDDLLAFSRVHGEPDRGQEVDLGVVVATVVDDLEARVIETGGRVDVGPLATIAADPTRMRQLFQNLIGNGLKFHRPGTPPVVTVTAVSVEGDLCRVLVADNGIGFDQGDAERIFGVFERLRGRGEYEGTGIGLALCRRIVEGHRGSVVARSVPGEGSTFEITLPIRAAPQPVGA